MDLISMIWKKMCYCKVKILIFLHWSISFWSIRYLSKRTEEEKKEEENIKKNYSFNDNFNTGILFN